MLNFAQIGISASALGGVLPQYQAVLDRAVTLGYSTPDAARNAAWNDFLGKRIADGSYAKIDVMWNYAWNNSSLSDFSRLNHVTPASHTATYQNSPTYGTGGIKGNGSNAYVDLNFNPATHGVNYTLNSASMGTWISTAPNTGNRVLGNSSGTNRITASNSVAQRINSSNINASVIMGVIRYNAMDRVDSTNVNVFIGTTKNARTATSTSVSSENAWLLREGTFYSDAELAFYYMGASLSETQHNNIANDYQTFLTAIGL